jgi:16S rRNA (cytidine1402-2'-O)-methyltransferase
MIFLESPHRLVDSLEDLNEVLGSRRITIGREMTKLHEEFFRGTLPEARQYFEGKPPRGEFTLVVQGADPESLKWSREQVIRALQRALEDGGSASRIAKELAAQSGWSRSTLYDLITELKSAP